MADSAAHLVDEVLPDKPIRQWVLSVPFPLRFLFAVEPDVMSKVLGDSLSRHQYLPDQAGWIHC
jgi:hypothetical protein